MIHDLSSFRPSLLCQNKPGWEYVPLDRSLGGIDQKQSPFFISSCTWLVGKVGFFAKMVQLHDEIAKNSISLSGLAKMAPVGLSMCAIFVNSITIRLFAISL